MTASELRAIAAGILDASGHTGSATPCASCLRNSDRVRAWAEELESAAAGSVGVHPAPAPGCPFCEIAAGDAPATVVREWDDALAILPLNPVTEGHTLVIPRVHVESFYSSPDVSAAVMRRAAELGHGLEHWEGVYGLDANIITSIGVVATQTVRHLHVHVVPRRKDDGLPLPWSRAIAVGAAGTPTPPDAEATK